MTTILEAMTTRALLEFDELAAKQEILVRDACAAQGHSPQEIETYISTCHSRLEAQRDEIRRLVAAQLNKAGIPLDGDARVLTH